MISAADLIFYACFLFCWVRFLWEFYLSWRQFVVYKRTERCPEEVLDVLDQERFEKARLYKIDKALFNFATAIWDQLLASAILLYNVLPVFWNLCGRIIGVVGISNEILQSLLVVWGALIIVTLLSLPWSMFDTFVIEEKHGFNKQTLPFFLKDRAKKLGVSLLIAVPLTTGIIWIIQKGGDYFFIYVFLFVSTATFLYIMIYPDFIAPLFDKYTPLEEGELKTKIESLAASVQFPLKKLLIVEGSKRSSHSNAYFFGLWKNKRIVLFDTLFGDKPLSSSSNVEQTAHAESSTEDVADKKALDKDKKDKNAATEHKRVGMSDDEILAILAHELGHWKLNHNLINLLFVEVHMFVSFAVFALLYKMSVLYVAFGFIDEKPVFMGLTIIVTYIFAPFNELTTFLITFWSRRMEFAADKFSARLGYAKLLQSSLIKLSVDNLVFPVDDRLYSTWHYSHPPVAERLHTLKKLE